jgi:Ca2+-binding EF-hand superfamily protein
MNFISMLQSVSGGLLCCLSGRGLVSPERELDRLELAFKRVDKNNEGYVTWDEFSKV